MRLICGTLFRRLRVQDEVCDNQSSQLLVLRGKAALLEFQEDYRNGKVNNDGVGLLHQQRCRLPFFLWVRRVDFDMDRTVLRMGCAVAIMLVLVWMREPWWTYAILALVMAVTAPFYLTVPRLYIIDNPTPEQFDRHHTVRRGSV